MKMQWALIAGLVFALLTGIFAVINVDSVQVNLLFNTVQIPLILLILGCTLIGGIIVGHMASIANTDCNVKINN